MIKARIVKPDLSIRKKLGHKTRFDQVFSEGVIRRAEKALSRHATFFKEETAKDFNEMKAIFAFLDEATLDDKIYNEISEIAFSIKSRAGTGGSPLASSVANSMFKFCDAAAIKPPHNTNGYKTIRLHFDALNQVFNDVFPANDVHKSIKLVVGLEEVSKRMLSA